MVDGDRVVPLGVCYLVAEENLSSTVYKLESDLKADTKPVAVQILNKIGRCSAA